MVQVLDTFENLWLEQTSFIAGDNLTVADIFAVCEIEQLKVTGYDPYVGRPKLAAWYERVKNQTSPYYDEAHKKINSMYDKFLKILYKLIFNFEFSVFITYRSLFGLVILKNKIANLFKSKPRKVNK